MEWVMVEYYNENNTLLDAVSVCNDCCDIFDYNNILEAPVGTCKIIVKFYRDDGHYHMITVKTKALGSVCG